MNIYILQLTVLNILILITNFFLYTPVLNMLSTKLPSKSVTFITTLRSQFIKRFGSTQEICNLESKELIIRQALTVLSQKATVLETISAKDYTRKLPGFFNASVGSHMRHSVDHFRILINAIDGSSDPASKIVNYDERKRNTDIEFDPNAALTAIMDISRFVSAASAQSNSNVDQSVNVAFIGETDAFSTYTVKSTFARELSFASHHAVHHLSMIKLMLNHLNYTEEATGNNIGMAFSTVKENERNDEKEEKLMLEKLVW